MCLAIPARIETIENGVATCRVGDSETFVKASLLLLDGQVGPGDYLVVHAGFALRAMDVKEAEESLQVMRDMAAVMNGGDVHF